MNYLDFIIKNVSTGRISELNDLVCEYYKVSSSELTANSKLLTLCYSMAITPEDIDSIIADHSEVYRTVKGHTFEVVFDYVMNLNKTPTDEVGGDSDVDRLLNDCSLQLKTPFVNGCTGTAVSYKTHKTHGAKSESESIDYYHKVSDFADYLVGLVSYQPYNVLIIPKEELPTVRNEGTHITSPMLIEYINSPFLNNYEQLGIKLNIDLNELDLSLDTNELLPRSSHLLSMKTDFILRAIFIKENFRIWDMNMRGFIREHVLRRYLTENSVKIYPPTITGLERPEKCDLVLKSKDGTYKRFQVKGLTWKQCKIKGEESLIDCETQLSRGRVNDHPTQSRLYMSSDFEGVIIAVDPPYENTLSLEVFGKTNYNWGFYVVPTEDLKKHHVFSNRIASHQRILYTQLQKYKITDDWLQSFIK